MQVMKHGCAKCVRLYAADYVNVEFQGMMPLEYAIRNCELATVKLTLQLGGTAQPLDMLKMAVLRGDLHILA